MMSGVELIVQYLTSCFGGTLAASECGPAWHFTIIGVLIVAGIAALAVMRARGAKEPDRRGQ